MNCIRMKISFRKSVLNVLIWGVMMLFAYPLSAQTNGKPSKGLYELFSTKIPDGAQWENRIIDMYATEDTLRSQKTIYIWMTRRVRPN